jgi:PAS domain S-box-containing protein
MSARFMSKLVDTEELPGDQREKLIGLGESSISKSYYPELRQRLDELERFRELMEGGNDAIFLVDAKTGLLADAIGAAGRFLGPEKERRIGRPFADVLAPGAADRLGRLYAGALDSDTLETHIFDTEAHTRPGVPVEMTIRAVEFDHERWAVAVARDIAGRLETEKALRQAEAKYRGIFENAVEGLFQSSRLGRFMSVNPAMASMLGYSSPAQLMREVLDIHNQLYVDGVDRDKLLRRLEDYGAVRGFETRLRRRDGKLIWASINVRAVYGDNGEVSFIEGSCEDVTLRKEAEEALVAARDELELRVRERTAELTRTNERLKREVKERKRAEEAAEAANRTKTEFLSMVSHEIRTPLTSVLGFAKIIMKKLVILFKDIDFKDPAKAKIATQVLNNLNIISSEGGRLTALINDVLDIAKMEAGKIDFNMELLQVGEFVERAAAATEALFAEKDVRLVTEAEEGLPLVYADSDRIIQVLVNLISNAVKFTDHGSVTCRVAAQNNDVVVSVIDTGIGIAPKDFPKVFDKYAQIGEHLTSKPKGTGLGLPICKFIVESHGGRIWFVSEPGKGSAFSFSLPVPSISH